MSHNSATVNSSIEVTHLASSIIPGDGKNVGREEAEVEGLNPALRVGGLALACSTEGDGDEAGNSSGRRELLTPVAPVSRRARHDCNQAKSRDKVKCELTVRRTIASRTQELALGDVDGILSDKGQAFLALLQQ